MSEDMHRATKEDIAAITTAREMAAAGIPIFVCPPNPYKPGKYFFQAGWQNTVADPAVLDRWQPGWGVAAVGGGAADFLDVDPRAGGQESAQLLKQEGAWPLTFGTQSTPSGGTHHVISRTGERKETGFMPGLDFQAGSDTPDEKGSYGRAFVWLAPTVGVSKETGELVPYRWVEPPDLAALDEWRAPDGSSSDASTEGIVARVHAHRALRARRTGAASADQAIRTDAASAGSQLFMTPGQVWAAAGEQRLFTPEEARAFTEPALEALKHAPIGQIEERGMAATLALEHFVPAFLTPQQAYAVILEALSHTAYDPHGPSDWTADKFLARLDGRRPVPDSWKATMRSVEPLATQRLDAALERTGDDATDALLAEMLTPNQVRERPPKRFLIKGLLHLDSEAWLIGKPGSRKSFVVLDMAGHIATGQPWQGRRVHQGPVVIIAAEGAGGIGARMKAWEMEHGTPLPDSVRVLPRPVQAADVAAWAVLVKACARLQPVLVVLDTQARMTVGLEENSAKDMGMFINAVGAIRMATGACVMPIHHTGRGDGDARGSSALDGAQDTELKVVALPAPLSGELRVEKQKDLATEEAIALTFAVHAVGVDEDGEPVTSLAVRAAAGGQEYAGAWVDEVEDGQVESVRAPARGDWTWTLVPHNRSDVQRRILAVLHGIAGETGRTESQVQAVVRERWYGGRPLAKKRAGYLSGETWQRAWTDVLALQSASGEPAVTSAGGQRYAINPQVVSDSR